MRNTLAIAVVACLSLAFGTAQAAEAKMAAKMPAGIQAKEITAPPAPPFKVLADAKGMTLYTFDKDEGGKSACNGECAHFWLPVAATATDKASGVWTMITREDGSKQWAYKGKPIYTFLKDTRVEDFDGNDQPKDKPVWHYILAGK